MNHPYNGNRDPRGNSNWGKGNQYQQKPKVDITHTVESTIGINLKVDITYFSFRDIEKFNKELKVIGVNELSVSKKFQNEVAWINIPNTSKLSKIEEIYHRIVSDTALGQDVQPGQGITVMQSNVSGFVLSKVLTDVEDGEKLTHRGAIGMADISMDFYAGGKFNDTVPLQDGYFHFYEGDYIGKNEYIQHDLAVEYPGEQTIKRGNRAVITTEPLRQPKHEFKLRPNRKAVVITYKFIDVIEKAEGVFFPIYEVQPYYFNQPTVGSPQMTFGKPMKRVDTLIAIMKDYQNQGFGYITHAAIDDLSRITEHHINTLLNERGLKLTFTIDQCSKTKENVSEPHDVKTVESAAGKKPGKKQSKHLIQDSDLKAPVEESVEVQHEAVESETITTIPTEA